MKEFLEKELDKLKMPKGERKYLIEEFVEWRWESFEEDFEKEHGRKPTEKEGKQFVKEYIDNNAEYRKPAMRQVEKERGQMQCLLYALRRDQKRLTVEDMSDLLIRSGFSKGSSVKTIYKRIIKELAEYNIKKGSDGKYYYDNAFEEQNTISGSSGCYKDEDYKLYRIKFEKDSYAWLYAKDRIWGKKQTIEETKKGCILSFEANQFKSILRWTLGWGDEAEPIEPEELVDEWKNKITKMMKKI